MPTNNLPLLLTSFIGREHEVAEACKLLQNTHLLTFTGAGGSGKTRLALAVASELQDDFRDGVWFVELASLTDPALVHQAVASVLDVREVPGKSMVETLTAHLKSRQLLLLIDNCEHLIEDCARMVYDLLLVCPDLQILATSREPLHIAGEVTWLVPPLSLPNPEQLPDLDELLNFGAVHLFVERAMSVLPSFTLEQKNALPIAQICCWLGGIPLAIELAAARVRYLTPEGIASRLDDVFQLLIGRDRFTPTRHQTLQATLDWSYNLLPEPEQILFWRLSVFAGGFSLEAAEMICADSEDRGMPDVSSSGVSSPGVHQGNILHLLASLVDKSLVLVDRETDHGQRFRLLELVRQYSTKKLRDSGEMELVRERHLSWYLALAEKAAPELAGSERRLWIELLEQETPNLRAASDWSLAQAKRAHLGVRLAIALSQFWELRGYFSEGMERLEMALSRSSESSVSERAAALHCAGFLAAHMRDTERAKRYLWKAVELSEVLGDRKGIAAQKHLLGWTAMQEGDLEATVRLGEESLALHREIADYWGTASALFLLGDLAFIRGDISSARIKHEESLALSRQFDFELAIPRRLTRLGQIACTLGEREQARLFFEESLHLSLGGGDYWSMAMALAGMAGLAKARRHLKHAASLLGATQAFLDAFGTSLWPLDRLEYEKNITEVKVLLGEQAFKTAWSQGIAFEIRDLDRLIQFALFEPNQTGEVTGLMEQESDLRAVTELQATKREFSGLTRREREVAALIAQGKSNSEIAAFLFVGIRTVEAHVTHILNKLGFNSRTQIAGWAVDKGLAHPPQVREDQAGMK